MKKAEVITKVSQMSGVPYDACEKILKETEKQMSLSDALKMATGSLKTKVVIQDGNLDESTCEKVLNAFDEVIGKGVDKKLKFFGKAD